MTRFVLQTKFGGVDAPEEKQGDCYPACLASLLGLPLAEVPCFPGKDWVAKSQEWLGNRGFAFLTFSEDPTKGFPEYKSVVSIAAGLGPRGHRHAVLWQNGNVLHDPHPSGEGLVGEPDEFDLLILVDGTKL